MSVHFCHLKRSLIFTVFCILQITLFCIACSNSVVAEDKDSAPVQEKYLPVPQGKFIPGAIFNTPFTLLPPNPLNGGAVHCTFDGSEPDTSSQILFENKVVDSTMVVRCTEFKDGKAFQKQVESYFINEDIRMPILSISVAPSYMSDYLDGEPCSPSPCYGAKFWENVETPAHVEYFAKGSASSKKDFEIDAGISIIGNWSRNQQKKSVSIIMREKYGHKRLLYPLFDSFPEKNVFKAFNLRNNGQRFISDYIEDAVATTLLENTNVDYQRSKQVIVFYNGIFHGIYDMKERLNEHYIETNYGIAAKKIDMIKHKHAVVENVHGNSESYVELLRYIYNSDFKNNDIAYDSVLKMIDIVNYMEYMAAEIYYQNNDWPQNNVRAWRSDRSLWKFIAFDIDMGFDWTKNTGASFKKQSMIKWIVDGGRFNEPCAVEQDYNCFHIIFKKLVQNSSFKKSFINRSAYFYSTFVNSKTIANRIDAINKSIDDYQITRDREMYHRMDYKNTCGTGFDPYGDCLKKWSFDRDKIVRNDFRDYFNLGKDVAVTLKIKGNGTLKMDGFPIVNANNYILTLFENHPVDLTVECSAGTFFKSWENGYSDVHRIIEPKADDVYVAECI